MKPNMLDKTVGSFNYEFIRGLSAASAGFAEFGECLETMGRIRENDFGSWIAEWSVTAQATEAYAKARAGARDVNAAKAAYARASNYYRMAAFYAVHTDPAHRSLWQKSLDCFAGMVALSDESGEGGKIETVKIPFGDSSLPAYFIPAGRENRPVLIAMGGFDSTKEEVYSWIGEAARSYGYNCLIFEGPGQWGALMDDPNMTFRPDYEIPVGACVDYLMGREGIDRESIAIIGYSMGGYLCMRGALDPRIKACIPNTLVADCSAAAKAGMKGLVRFPALADSLFSLMARFNVPARWGFNHSAWTLGIRTATEWVQAYENYTLLGHEEKLAGKDILFMFSEDDIIDAAAPSPEIVSGLLEYIASLKEDTRKYSKLFTRLQGASSHCQMGGLAYAHASIFAWLEHVLCASPLETDREGEQARMFCDWFEKNGGKKAGLLARALVPEIAFIE